LAHEAVRAKIVASGAEPAGNSPLELSNLVKADLTKWTRVIRDKKIKAD
jgi:tripartite-type tricarboxylate transporter receptor subunit TctC